MEINQIINLTPHSIEFDKLIIKPESTPLRIDIEDIHIGNIMGVDFFVTEKTKTDEPPVLDGVIYVVSNMTASTYPHRLDFFIPRLVGDTCRGLILNPYFDTIKFRTEDEYMQILNLNKFGIRQIKEEIKQGNFCNINPRLDKHGVCVVCGNVFIKKMKKSNVCSTHCSRKLLKIKDGLCKRGEIPINNWDN